MDVWTQAEPLFSCRDLLCGKLFCQNGQENPKYGRMVTVNGCKAAFFDDYTRDYGQVDSGTKCGDGQVTGCRLLFGRLKLPRASESAIRLVFFQVCSQNECVDLEVAYRNTNCSAKCPGHAVSTCPLAQTELQLGSASEFYFHMR